MSKEHGPSLHVEWSPGRVTAVDVNTGRTQSGIALGELAALLNGHKSALVGISRQLVFLKIVSLPKASPEDLRRILGIQLSQLFPLPADQLSFDFLQTAERQEDGYTTLVAAVRADDLRQLTAELQQAGIRADRVLPVALGSVAVAARATRAEALVVEEAASGCTLDIVSGGIVRVSRTTADCGDADREVQRTLAAAGIGHLPVLLAGTGAPRIEGVTLQAKNALELLHEAPAFTFELAEERVREQQRRAALRNRLAILMMLSALLLVALVWTDRSDADAKVKHAQGIWARQLTREHSIRDAYVAEAQSATVTDATIQAAFVSPQPVSDIAAVIGDSLPKSGWITGLSVERGKPVQIRGTVTDANDVARFLKILADSGRFRDVRLVVANSGRISTTPVVEFSVTATAIGNLPLPLPEVKRPTTARRPAASTDTEQKQ